MEGNTLDNLYAGWSHTAFSRAPGWVCNYSQPDYKGSWAPKNRCFWMWCWSRLLRVPWTARRSNHSILKAISPGCSLEGLMLKLKLQHFGHLMQRADSSEKTLMLGKTESGRRRGWQRMRWLWHHWLNGHEFGQTPGVGDGQGGLACCNPWDCRVRHDWVTELNWTETNKPDFWVPEMKKIFSDWSFWRPGNVAP